MKKALFAGALALALGLSGISYAQTQNQTPPSGGPGWGHCGGGGPGWHGGGGHRGGPGWHRGGPGMGGGWGMARDMNLSQAQQDQINKIMDKKHSDTQNQIRAVLNADQRKIFDQRQTQREAWRKQWQQAPNQ